MKTTAKARRDRAVSDLDNVSQAIAGLIDEVRVQVHLGAMELKTDAGPYLAQVSDASKAAARDLVKRGKALRAELKSIRAAHKKA